VAFELGFAGGLPGVGVRGHGFFSAPLGDAGVGMVLEW
jgi:hypothetical protein